VLVKRLFDVTISLLGLIMLAPLLIIIALLVKTGSRGPVLFRQTRVGQFGVCFQVLKFRTMVVDAEKIGPKISAAKDERITRIGNILRQLKLDEIPQLVNVLVGQMSLVGPRPEVPKYVALFREDYEEILKIKPGITDFASLEYRNEGDLLELSDDPDHTYLSEILPAKIVQYKRYIREQSLMIDVKLIAVTIWSALFG
jgi:lipopolysaccharide/colanic/teichoic acid biosynthesis glycosyltransferase